MTDGIILFLCTGNYYRSRFAEHLFNHHAQRLSLPWRAESRGLAVELAAGLPGTISRDTVARLVELNVACGPDHRCGIACSDGDLSRASLVIALKEAEHRPLLAARHPGWEERVQYWHVHDLDSAGADVALAEIERLVVALIEDLQPSEQNEVDERE